MTPEPKRSGPDVRPAAAHPSVDQNRPRRYLAGHAAAVQGAARPAPSAPGPRALTRPPRTLRQGPASSMAGGGSLGRAALPEREVKRADPDPWQGREDELGRRGAGGPALDPEASKASAAGGGVGSGDRSAWRRCPGHPCSGPPWPTRSTRGDGDLGHHGEGGRGELRRWGGAGD
ncbi:DNA replication licensing factor MCM4-like [Panicum virgatum]|uniref:DNA replication licensing factor MCM4-like n=1 Tax=Panicum virgatum TaxID=38727 RepID=UPI0019D648BC|nr:DNA replication licensing factor MCM4-like [Panicum virgatum]